MKYETKVISSIEYGGNDIARRAAYNAVENLVKDGWTIEHSHCTSSLVTDVYDSNPHAVYAKEFDYCFILKRPVQTVLCD